MDAEELRAYKREYQRRPEQKEKMRAYQKKYYALPEVKEHRKKYSREHWRKYVAVPEHLERINERRRMRYSTPEGKAMQYANSKKYRSKPEVRAKLRMYCKQYRLRKKQQEQNNKSKFHASICQQEVVSKPHPSGAYHLTPHLTRDCVKEKNKTEVCKNDR